MRIAGPSYTRAVVVGATAFAVLASWSGAAATATTVVAPRALATTVESPADLPGYEVFRPRNLDATGKRLPVIVWANGGCVRHNRTWLPLLEAWAQAGYVVVAIASPPEGSTLSPRTTAADQAAAIDWAVKQNKLAGGRYARRLDLRRIVAAGNSCGGITTIALASTDPRVNAVFVLSGSGSLPGTPVEQARQAMSGVTVPIAYVSGGPEDISRGAVETDLAVLPANTAAYAAFRATGDHPTVSTANDILVDEVAVISLNWYELALYGSATALRVLTTDPCPRCAPDVWTARHQNLTQLAR